MGERVCDCSQEKSKLDAAMSGPPTVLDTPSTLPVLDNSQLRCVAVCEDRALFLTRSGDVYSWKVSVPPDSATPLLMPSPVRVVAVLPR